MDSKGSNECSSSVPNQILVFGGYVKLRVLLYTKGCQHGKYTTPLPCTSLSESDTKPYSDFEIFEGKNHRHLKNTLIYKANQIRLTIFFEKSLRILEYGACSV